MNKNNHQLFTFLTRKFWVVFTACLLTACSTSHKQTVNYYQLEHPEVVYSQTAGAPTIVIKQIQMPPFYNGRGIVMQTNQYQRAISDWNLWADSPDRMLTNHLVFQLRASLNDHFVVSDISQLDQQSSQEHTTVSISIHSFTGTNDGQALISGEYAIENASKQAKKPKMAIKHFHVKTPLTKDGYPALVKAIETAWKEVGKTIIAEFKD